MKIPKNWYVRLIVSAILALLAFFLRRFVLDISFPVGQEANITFVMFIILVAIWTFFANINKWLDNYYPFDKNTTLRITVQIVLGSAFVLIIRLSGLYTLWDNLPFTNDPFVVTVIIAMDIFIALTINLAVISNYIIKKWKQSILKSEKLEQESIQIQYQTLRNQVNPHLLFNTFASLQAMINENPEAASMYVGHLSKLYRYAMSSKDNILIPLEKEVEMVIRYSKVLKMRYEDQLTLKINVNNEVLEKDIVHMTLHNLVDNAIKHNEIHANFPLDIAIESSGNQLIITNNRRPKELLEPSTKQGLSQLKKLYTYYTDDEIIITESESFFRVRIPLL